MKAAQRIRAAWRGGPLADRNFRLLTAGQFTSTAGDFCYAVALPWLVLSTHGGPVLLGTVLACYGVPRTVLIPFGGWLADKVGPRAVMLGADMVRCCLVALLAVFATRHVASLAALGPAAALLGAGEGLFLPASFAIMPSLLAPDLLQAGNALNSAAVQLGSLLGPVLGGVLVASAGSASAFAVDAASFAVSALTLGLLVSRARAVPEADTAAADPAEPRAAADAAAASAAGSGPATAGEACQVAARPAGDAPAGPGRAGPEPRQPSGVWPLLRHSRLYGQLPCFSGAGRHPGSGLRPGAVLPGGRGSARGHNPGCAEPARAQGLRRCAVCGDGAGSAGGTASLIRSALDRCTYYAPRSIVARSTDETSVAWRGAR